MYDEYNLSWKIHFIEIWQGLKNISFENNTHDIT